MPKKRSKMPTWCPALIEEGKNIASQAEQLRRLNSCLGDCETAITAAQNDFYRLRELCRVPQSNKEQQKIDAAYLLGRAGFYHGKAAERAEARGRRRGQARARRR